VLEKQNLTILVLVFFEALRFKWPWNTSRAKTHEPGYPSICIGTRVELSFYDTTEKYAWLCYMFSH